MFCARPILLLGLFSLGCQSPSSPDSPTPTPHSIEVVTFPVARRSFEVNVRLTGQVRATEGGSVLLNAPLDGVVVRPLVKVGSRVQAQQPVLEMNSVYGLTSLQILERLEKEQDDVVEARARLSNALTQQTEAAAKLGEAQSKIASLEADRRQAEADLAYSRSDFKRKQELNEHGISSRAEVEEARTHQIKCEALSQAATEELRIARSQLPLYRNNISQFQTAVALARESVQLSESNYQRNRMVLSRAELVGSDLPRDLTSLSLTGIPSVPSAAQASTFFVRAPIAGTVTKFSVTPGQRLPAGAEIGQVQELSEVYVDANAFESDVSHLQAGNPITVTSSGHTFRGRLDYVGQAVDPQTRTIPVRSLIHNTGGQLRPDTFVEVSIKLPRQEALVVPREAILRLGEEDFVLLQDAQGVAHKQRVQTGVTSEDMIEIGAGLKQGDQVITRGSLLLEARER